MRSRLDSRLLRIEVHAVALEEEDAPALRWDVRAGIIDEDLVFFGYLSQRGVEGFGQAQAIAIGLKVAGETPVEMTEAEVVEWGELYVFEPLWDLLRRALQAQATAMDFQLDIPTKAVEPEIHYQTYEEAFGA